VNVGKLVAVLACGALLVGACGGGSRPDHHEYTNEVGRICRRANVRLSRVELHRLRGPKAAAAVDELVAIGRSVLADLRSQQPPKADEATVDEWLAALEQVLDEGDYASSLLRAGDRGAAFAAAGRASQVAARAHALGRQFGVPDACRIPSLVALG
jgi:hypothetical protein